MIRPSPADLAEYALGILPDAERRRIEAAVAQSPALQRELAALHEGLGVLPEQLPKVQPRNGGKAALLAALGSSERFSPFVRDLARHFDLPAARVRELLRLTDDPSAWQASPVPGISMIDFPSGPNAIASHAGFVTFPKGLEFPYHRHLGPELNYVLQGSMQGDDGHLYIPGELLSMPADSAHEFSFPHERTLVAVIHLGFEFVPKPG